MNNALSIELFRFNHKTDYLPYYKKYNSTYNPTDTVLDLLTTLYKNEKFCFDKIEDYGVKINNIFVKSTDLIEQIVSKTSSDLIIEPVSTYRAIEDLKINTDDFFEKLSIFDDYLSEEQKEQYSKDLQFEYYSSNTLNINKDYIGDHCVIIANDLINSDQKIKNDILKLVSDTNNGVWYSTSKEKRILNPNTTCNNQITNMIQEVTKYQVNTHTTEENITQSISQKFSDFNIAVYDLNDTQLLQNIILNSDAKYINIDSKNDDLALQSQEVNKTFSYKIAGNVLLEAKDKNADFIVVKTEDSFKFFDHKQKEIEKAVGRDIQMPVITLKQFNTLLSGEKNRDQLGFNSHKVSVPFL